MGNLDGRERLAVAAEGIVGEYKGSQAREVLFTLEDWEAQHGTAEGQNGAG
jgi:hypothetical protein